MTELEPHAAPPLITLQEIRNHRCCNCPRRVVLYSTRCFKRFLVILPLFQLCGSLIFFWDCINRTEPVVDRAFPDIQTLQTREQCELADDVCHTSCAAASRAQAFAKVGLSSVA